MSGIAGVLTADGAAPGAKTLAVLTSALAHRGPDGEGRFAGGSAILVHTRLAVTDLENGEQPLYSSDGAVLVADCAIVNHRELRRELPAARFATATDAEAALQSYVRSGADFARPLRGMYALALFDPTEQTLMLARDRFGIKPLYTAETPQGLVFASELQAILKLGWVERRIRRDAAVELLQLQFNTGRETIFGGVRRVRPGETVIARNGRIVERRQEPALPSEGPAAATEDEALAALDAALRESVALHAQADVPIGLFFSGGVNSTALLACMTDASVPPARAYTAVYPGYGAREDRDRARRIARMLGVAHEEVEVSQDDFWQGLPQIAASMDDPAADYALVPLFRLAEEAARELKVVLCGEGGDELFGGYGRYRSLLRPFWLGGRTMRAKGALDGLGVLRDETNQWRDGIVSAENKAAPAWTRLQSAQAVDVGDWLPNDVLTKVDRCLMAHAVEGRMPLLDSALAEVAFRLPDRLKIAKGQGKALLRRWLERRLPGAGGFAHKRAPVPVAEWIRQRANHLAGYIARQEGVAEICRPDAVRLLFHHLAEKGEKRMAQACWHLLFYALWHEIHVQGAPAEGGAVDVLGGKR